MSDQHVQIWASIRCFKEGNPVFGVNSVPTNINGSGTASIAQRYLANTDSIEVNALGYQSAAFKITGTDRKDYTIVLTEGTNKKDQIEFFLNKGKGYPFKIKSNLVALQFSGVSSGTVQSTWMEFQKIR